jgi:hypothetical protein
VFKFRGRPGLCTLQFLILLYCISYQIWDNVSFKFGAVNKHSIYLFVCFIGCFDCFYLYIFVFFSVYKIFSFCLLLCC